MNEMWNIKIKNNILEFNYRCEDLKDGYVKYDIDNDKILEIDRSEYSGSSFKAAFECIGYIISKYNNNENLNDKEVAYYY